MTTAITPVRCAERGCKVVLVAAPGALCSEHLARRERLADARKPTKGKRGRRGARE